MNFLDVRTVIFSHLVTDVLCTLVIASLWRQNRQRLAGTAWWVLDFALQAAATLLIILRGSIPDWMSMVLANTLVIAGAIAGYVGLERFSGKTSRQVHNYLLLAAFVGVHTYFLLVQPNLAARTLNLSLGLLIVSFQCAWLIGRRVRPDLRRMMLGVGLVFGAFCLISLVRIAVILASPPPGNDFFQSGAFDTLILMSYQMLLILLAYSLILMVSGRLLAEIQTQEEKFAKAFRSSPYAILLTRLADGRILEVNDGFVDISGYSRAEALGQTTLDLRLWAREEERAVIVNALSKSQKVRGAEFQFRKKSGAIMIGLYSAEIITLDNQPWILSSIDDITERNRAEEVLRVKDWAIESAINAIAISDLAGNLTYVNPAFLKLWGYSSPAEAMGKSVTEFWQMGEKAAEVIETLRAQGGWSGEMAAHGKEGALFDVQVAASMVRNVAGEPICMMASFVNITDRKRAEEALRQNEERYRQAQQIGHVGNWEFNLNTNTFWGSDEAKRLYGFDPQQDDFSVDEVENCIPERERVHQALIDLIQAGKPYNLEFEIKPRNTTQSRIISSLAELQTDEAGRPHKVLGIIQDITERQQAELKLASAQERLNEAHRLAHIGTWDWVIENDTVTWSEELCHIAGWDPSRPAPSYAELPRIYTPASWELLSGAVTRALTTGEPYNLELELIRPDGGLRWINAFGGVKRDGKGKVIGLHGTVQDITERQRAEEALRETNAYLENLINYANAPIIVWDPHFRITRFNHAFEFLTGRTEAEVIGQSLEILFPPAPAENSMALIRQTLTGERWETVEIQILHRDESVRTVLWNSATLFAADGQTPIATIAQGQDITERKQAEEALRESEAKLSSILGNMRDVVWSLAWPDLTTLFLSPSVELVYGRPAQEFYQDIALWQKITYPEDAQVTEEAFKQLMETGVAERECRVIKPDGSVIWIHDKSRMVFDESGQPIRVDGITTDITARKQAEAALHELNATLEQRVADRTRRLAEANAQLSELDRLKDNFISRISHELRTPLTSIMIYLELLENAKPEKRAKYMQVLNEQAARLRQLIESLLEVTEKSGNAAGVRVAPTDLNHLAASLAADMAPRAAERGLTLTTALTPDLPFAAADAISLAQALSKLAANALNYTPAGGTIELSTAEVIDEGETWITFTIRDTGPGVAPDEQSHIFDRFYRGRAAADYKVPGAGIGLAISRDLLTLMAGRLTVQSDGVPGHGAAFTAWLKPA